MIRKASELNEHKRFRVLLYGVPGIAKSTTGLSAPNPLMIDTDGGWDRVPVQHRRGSYIQPETYDEILSDLTAENVADFETLVFDTGGTLLDLMKTWAIKKNPTNGQKDGSTLSMRGYGAIGAEFSRLMEYCFFTLKKHVVVIFHAREDKDGESKVFRVDVEGQTARNIWKDMDIGGFMEAIRDTRVIGFTPTDRYFAKGTHGITGQVEIPNVMKPGVPNDFLVTLFAKINQNIKEESAVVEEYDKLMVVVRNIVETVTSADTANAAALKLSELKYVFSAKAEAWHILKDRASKCGLAFSKEKGWEGK